jgi:hypothetical protein
MKSLPDSWILRTITGNITILPVRKGYLLIIADSSVLTGTGYKSNFFIYAIFCLQPDCKLAGGYGSEIVTKSV